MGIGIVGMKVLSKALEQSNWKHDLAVAAAGAFMVTLFTKLAEGAGDALMSRLRRQEGEPAARNDAGCKCTTGKEVPTAEGQVVTKEASSSSSPSAEAVQPEQVSSSSAGVSVPGIPVEGSSAGGREVGYPPPAAMSIDQVPPPNARSHITIRKRGTSKYYVCTHVLGARNLRVVDPQTLSVTEEPFDKYEVVFEDSKIPTFDEWAPVTAETPIDSLVANGLWYMGPVGWGVVKKRSDGAMVVIPLLADSLPPSERECSYLDEYRVAPAAFSGVPDALANFRRI
jgi:hypothetical protein